MNRAWLLLVGGVVAVGVSCAIPPLAGGSSQQGNGIIAGYVVSADGSPAIFARIRVRSTTYVQLSHGKQAAQSDKLDAISDKTGRFSVAGLAPGKYTVEANDQTSSAGLVTASVDEHTGFVDVGTIGLRPYARIFGRVDFDTAASIAAKYVQVQGLERLARVGQDGTFAIVDLPEGNFDLRIVSPDLTTVVSALFGVNTKSDATASVTMPAGWRYGRRIGLNTSASGADVAGSVMDFPVLIRLTAEQFDFNLAQSDGADIRFLKSERTFLPYEIELWDPLARRAEIWVKVDTIRGGDSTQFLTLLWGNDTAGYCSNGASVFDTAKGFAGVWHLNDIGRNIYDATASAFNGINYGSSPVKGVVGNARSFSNGDHIRIPGLLASPSSVTLSVWVLSDTSLARGQDIVSIGDAVLIRFDDILGIGTAGCYHNTALVSDTAYAKVNSGRYLAKTGWHHLAFSINRATLTQTLYIDGVPAKIAHDPNPISYAGLGADTYIGIHGNGKTGFNFIGRIDEVRVNWIPLTGDWVKLCFMNQKENDALVRW